VLAQNQKLVLLLLKKLALELQMYCKAHTWYLLLPAWAVEQVLALPQSLLK
jgi:hypothetical protein